MFKGKIEAIKNKNNENKIRLNEAQNQLNINV